MSAFRSWLQDRGCKGLEAVDISVDGRPGVRLRQIAPKGKAVLSVPQSAWIAVPVEGLELEPEAELAWRLVTERWLGEASEFAPYIEFLWSLDLSLHPAFWDQEEVAWLQASVEAHGHLLQVRGDISARVEQLVKRAQAPASRVPADVLADAAGLESELHFALVLVEARATEIEAPLVNQPPRAVMAPLLDHLQHDPAPQPVLRVGSDEVAGNEAMVALAMAKLPANAELACCYEPVGSSELLAHYGCVAPLEPDLDYAEVVSASGIMRTALPVRTSGERKQKQGLQVKLQLLAERVGVDLRVNAPRAAACLSLPEDIGPAGRLLPLARFLESAVPGAQGEQKASCETVFWRCFGAAAAKAQGSTTRMQVPLGREELDLEVFARRTVWEWCDDALRSYSKVFRTLSDVISSGAARPQEEVAAEAEVLAVDAIVLAHYKAKAKGPGAKGTVKSSRPRKARVLVLSEELVTVQFLANGVRHSVPIGWIEGFPAEGPAPPKPKEARQDNPQETGDGSSRLAKMNPGRARLAFTVLQYEAAWIEMVYHMTQDFVKVAAHLLEARDSGEEELEQEATKDLVERWQQEQETLRELFATNPADPGTPPQGRPAASVQEPPPQQVDAAVGA